MNDNSILNNCDIIMVGQQPWDVEIGSNNKNIAVQFSKNNRVLYVNSAISRGTAIKHKSTPTFGCIILMK